MTPLELRAIREGLDLTQAAFAPLVGAKGDRTVRMWESGQRKIPLSVEMLAHGLLKRGNRLRGERHG